MNSKKHKAVYILLTSLAIYVFYYGTFISPKGNLLCSYHQVYSPNYADGVYIVPFDKAKSVQLFFKLEGSWAYGYPYIQDGKFFCRLLRNNKNLEEGVDSTLVMVDDYKNNIANKDAVQILMAVPGFVQSPIITKDLKNIYYKKEDKLYAFNQETGKERQISEDKIEADSNLLLARDQNVIYTKYSIRKEGDRYITEHSIIELYPNGETKVLIENGRYPAWYEKDKSIIYSSDKRVTYIYHLATGEQEDLGPDDWLGSPIVSPDRKYMLVERKNPASSPCGGNDAEYTYFVTRPHSVEMKKMREEGNEYNGVPFWLEE